MPDDELHASYQRHEGLGAPGDRGPDSQEDAEPASRFRPASEMSDAEWEYWGREANRLYPKVNRRYR